MKQANKTTFVFRFYRMSFWGGGSSTVRIQAAQRWTLFEEVTEYQSIVKCNCVLLDLDYHSKMQFHQTVGPSKS